MDPIETTPLGLARKAIDTAHSEIVAAYEAWIDEPDGPYDYHDLEITPDSDSLGFALVLDFGDGPREDASKVAARLATVLLKHGIGTVRCISVAVDEFSVPVTTKGGAYP